MKHLIKDPPSVHILSDRGLAGAIDYYLSDQTLHFNEEKGGSTIRLNLNQSCRAILSQAEISNYQWQI